MIVPAELRALRLPCDWEAWSILSGKELEIPPSWVERLTCFLSLDSAATLYPLEVKDEKTGKKVLLEAQAFHLLNDKELGLLDGIRVQLPVRISLRFNAQGMLVDVAKEPPSDRDLKAACRHLLNLLAEGNVDLPGSLESFSKEVGPPKPWRIVQEEDGRFRLERAYFA